MILSVRSLKGVFYFLAVFIFFFLFFLSSVTKTRAAVLFQDNFNDGNANEWVVPRNMQWNNPSQSCSNDGAPVTWRVADGKYGISINGPGCVTETTPNDASWNDDWNDYIFEADITFITGTDANIAFRYSGAPNLIGSDTIS